MVEIEFCNLAASRRQGRAGFAISGVGDQVAKIARVLSKTTLSRCDSAISRMRDWLNAEIGVECVARGRQIDLFEHHTQRFENHRTFVALAHRYGEQRIPEAANRCEIRVSDSILRYEFSKFFFKLGHFFAQCDDRPQKAVSLLIAHDEFTSVHMNFNRAFSDWNDEFNLLATVHHKHVVWAIFTDDDFHLGVPFSVETPNPASHYLSYTH